ncbi:hypothetical protein [Oscillatoria acuminata]|uniref:Uncharacterized protein n=1 Tax=Oscillatoria acuminata PCC 6304 TaxID=56110 RepID=K9TDT7_9CYAN|nr:hypothetical protein [Oscillatoria acuminata]AFY80179.1 hypothetical protein Oscil6304_0430 [Oscillatoria acuminata PCC 6304]
MTYTIQDAIAVANRLKADKTNPYARTVGKLFLATANVLESTHGLEIVAGMRRDKELFFTEVLDSISEELAKALNEALDRDQLDHYFGPESDSEE